MLGAYMMNWDIGALEKAQLVSTLDTVKPQGPALCSNAYVVLLQACNQLAEGTKIHAHIIKSRCSRSVVLAKLVNMYLAFESLKDACQVFNQIDKKNKIIWTTMISAYNNQGYEHEAMELFQLMLGEGVKPDTVTFITVMSACASAYCLQLGKQIHSCIIQAGVESDVFVGSGLINMYAKCGRTKDALQIFNRMQTKDVVTWNVMIFGYAHYDDRQEAMRLFHSMQQVHGVKPTKVTCIAILGACTGDLGRGKYIHAYITISTLRSDVFLISALISMYAKSGGLEDADRVFYHASLQNQVLWNTMITGYAEYGDCLLVLDIFHKMQDCGWEPDQITFVGIISACTSVGSLGWGKYSHAQLMKSRLKISVALGNMLIGMYAKCGGIEDAFKVLDNMPKNDLISWNAIISGCTQQRDNKKALFLFWEMQLHSHQPDSVTYVTLLNTFHNKALLEEVKYVHSCFVNSGLDLDVFVGSILIEIYAQCGCIEDSTQVFVRMPIRNNVSWNAIISAYAEHGDGRMALKTFGSAQKEGIKLNAVTYIGALSGCANIGSLEFGKHIHTHLIESGIKLDIVANNTIIAMYIKCGSTQDACQVFDRMRAHDVISWNVIISAYARNREYKKCIHLFLHLQCSDLKPDVVTYNSVLSVCEKMGAQPFGIYVHAHVIKAIETMDIVVGTTIVGMYAKFIRFDEADKVFREIHFQDVTLWNALLSGYAGYIDCKEAMKIFVAIVHGDTKPDKLTYLSILVICTNAETLEIGKLVHAYWIKHTDEFNSDTTLGNTLASMYINCKSIGDAHHVLDRMLALDIVTWNVIISGYIKCGDWKSGLKVVEQMQLQGLILDKITYVAILNACADAGALRWGLYVYTHLANLGLASDHYVETALLYLYTRCGSIDDAQLMFNRMTGLDIVKWNILITGYAQCGDLSKSIELCNRMQQQGVQPDKFTFISVLMACNHMGLLDEGHQYFSSMPSAFDITPVDKHYGCLVHLLGRAGFLHEAMDLIGAMPFRPGIIIWTSVLFACKHDEPENVLSRSFS